VRQAGVKLPHRIKTEGVAQGVLPALARRRVQQRNFL
jgi:hypothetical protein